MGVYRDCPIFFEYPQWRNFRLRAPCKKIIRVPSSLTTKAYIQNVLLMGPKNRGAVGIRYEMETPKASNEEKGMGRGCFLPSRSDYGDWG